MRGYFYILEKNKSKPDKSFSEKIKRMFSEYLNKNIELSELNYNNISFINISNENNSNEISNNFKDEFHFGISGYFNRSEQEIFKELISTSNRDKVISQAGGIFSAALFEKSKIVFTVWNNITRAEPVYWCENEDRIVIGTKAIVVHLLGHDLIKPKYDISNFTSFLNNGYFADENTPYTGVKALRPNSKIIVQANNVSIKSIDDFFDNIYSNDPDSVFYDELTDVFLKSFNVLKKHETEYNLGLTGGKDSRLIIAAMQKLDLNLNTFTNGFEDNPDVIIAKRIANLLGVNHTVKKIVTPSKKSLSINLRSRAVDTIKNCDGMLYAYENMSGLGDNFQSSKVQLGGQGGELLRGGYAANNSEIKSKQQLLRFLESHFIKYKDFLNIESVNEYSEFLNKYINNYENLSYKDILNKFYLDYRCGRWSSSSRSAYTMNFYSYAPFFDSNLVRKAQSIKTKYGSNEEMIYNILLRLNPSLTQIPFAEDRWAFEKNKPYSKYDLNNWMKREPVYANSKLGGFNWRRNVLSNFKNEFYDVIFFDTNSPLFDIVDKNSVKQLFNNNNRNLNKYDGFLWSLYTASLLISNKWSETTENGKRIEVPVPQGSYKETIKEVPKVQSIPNTAIFSAHSKVKVNKASTNSVAISWKDMDIGDNLYFQIFDNPFSSPPSDTFEDLTNIEEKKELLLNFEVEKHTIDYFSLEIHVIQYDKNSKVQQDVNTIKVNNQINTYTIKIKKTPKSSTYKIAIKIKECNKSGSFTMQQIFTKMI